MPKRTSDDDTRGPFEEHPLFPLDEGGKPFEVAFISMARKEGGGMMWIPQIFPATELTKTEQILERFGGGVYELWARGASVVHMGQPGNVTKKRILTLPGKPKLIDPSNATVAEEIAAGVRASPLDVKPQSSGMTGDSSVLIAIMQMGQQASQAAAQQNQQFMALMMQMMQEGKKESAESMRMMMQVMTTMTTSQQQSMMQMLPLLVSTKGGGPAEIEQYLTLFQKMGFGGKVDAPKEEEENEVNVGEMVGHIATIVQGAPAALSALKEMGPGGAAGNGQVALPAASGEAPPGSAASVLQGRG